MTPESLETMKGVAERECAALIKQHGWHWDYLSEGAQDMLMAAFVRGASMATAASIAIVEPLSRRQG